MKVSLTVILFSSNLVKSLCVMVHMGLCHVTNLLKVLDILKEEFFPPLLFQCIQSKKTVVMSTALMQFSLGQCCGP
jgi:hypothetical protein